MTQVSLYLVSSSLVMRSLNTKALISSGSLLRIVSIAQESSHFARLESSAKIESRRVNRGTDTKCCRRKDVGNRKECELLQHAN